MKIAFIARSTLFTVSGGDTIQVMETVAQLNRRGVSAEIKLTHETIPYTEFDLLHFVNLTRPADIYYHIKRTTIPFVVSPILVSYQQYDRHLRPGIAGLLLRLTTPGFNEYLKTLARWITRQDRLVSLSYLWKGHHQCASEIVHRAALLLPNSALEQKRLTGQYQQPHCQVIPNGINPALFTIDETVPKNKNWVLCIARFEGLKNQYNLIKALNNTPYHLILIGAAAPNQPGYYQKCKQLAAANITFIDHLPQEELVHYYQRAAVHVLPSWFETCGLASLEAGAMGCNLVVTEKGYTREYFEDHAFYCDPASPGSIRQAIEQAALAPFPAALQNKIRTRYTWHQAAEKTLAAYQQVLNKA